MYLHVFLNCISKRRGAPIFFVDCILTVRNYHIIVRGALGAHAFEIHVFLYLKFGEKDSGACRVIFFPPLAPFFTILDPDTQRTFVV